MTAQPSQLNDRDLELLSSYIDGQLSADERRDIEHRLREEAALRLAYDELRATIQAVRDLEPVRPPRSFTLDPAVVAPHPPARRLNWGRLLQVSGVFAAVLVAAISTLSVLGTMGGGAPAQQAASEAAPAAAPMVAAAPTMPPQTTMAPLAAEAPMPAAAAPDQARESSQAAEAPAITASGGAEATAGESEPAANAQIAAPASEAAEPAADAQIAAPASATEAPAATSEPQFMGTPEAAIEPPAAGQAPVEVAPAQPTQTPKIAAEPSGSPIPALAALVIAILLAGGILFIWRRGRISR